MGVWVPAERHSDGLEYAQTEPSETRDRHRSASVAVTGRNDEGPTRMSEFGALKAGAQASERRFLTIEFIDLVGSTDLAEQLDPEDLGPLLRRYQRLAL